MYDITKYPKILKCPLTDIVCCRSVEQWSGFGCWCCLVSTQDYVSEDQIPWEDGEKYINALIDELWNLTCKEDGTLSSEECDRYTKIVDILHESNVEIPFGVEI